MRAGFLEPVSPLLEHVTRLPEPARHSFQPATRSLDRAFQPFERDKSHPKLCHSLLDPAKPLLERVSSLLRHVSKPLERVSPLFRPRQRQLR